MGIFGPSWRPPLSLRSLLLGGAAAVAWLALSSSAASADAGGSHSDSFFAGLTSSVSSVTSASGDALSAVSSHSRAPDQAPAPSPAPGSNGLLQPVVGNLTGPVDNLAGSLPVISQVVPAETVTNVITPVSAAVDDTAGSLAEAVIPPASETIPALQPVLDPIADVISDGDVTLPEPVADLVTQLVGDPPVPGPNLLDLSGAEHDSASALRETADAVSSAGTSTATTAFASGVSGMLWPPSMPLGDTSGVAGVSGETGPNGGGNGPPGPDAIPPAPGSGSSSGQSSGASSGGAACLTDFSLNLPQPGSTPASKPLQHAPAPVSFDPGSSPD